MFYSQIQPQPDLKRPDADLRMTKRPESAPDAGDRVRELRRAFGRNLREIRRAKGKKQDDVARAMGSTQSYIGQIERGETNVTLDTVQKLADAIGVSSQQMLFGSLGSHLTLDVLEKMTAVLHAKVSAMLKQHGETSITLEMLASIFEAMRAETRPSARASYALGSSSLIRPRGSPESLGLFLCLRLAITQDAARELQILPASGG
jgi:XRE family transcriptional regulator, regulator of sulfur utilization